MSSADLVREVKYKAKIDRDSDLAEILNVGRANVSAWLKERSRPDAIAVLKLAEIGNLSPKETRLILERGFSSVSLLLVTSFCSTLGLALVHNSYSLYIM